MQQEIFGREAELAAIEDFLSGLTRSPRALVLAGPAGSGKTTLLRAAAGQAAERGFTVLPTMPAQSDVRLALAFMETQDGRDHTQLGMERVIQIVK
jgi:DNA replication protein DnaC